MPYRSTFDNDFDRFLIHTIDEANKNIIPNKDKFPLSLQLIATSLGFANPQVFKKYRENPSKITFGMAQKIAEVTNTDFDKVIAVIKQSILD